MRLVFLIVLATLVVHGQSAKPGTVEGVVSNSVTSAPVKKALVVLARNRQLVEYSAVTDASGHFLISGVEPGTYTVYPKCQGFGDVETVPVVRVAEDQRAQIEVRLPPLSVVTGKVLAEDEEPLPGVTVQAMQSEYVHGMRRLVNKGGAVTDDRGQFRIFDLPAGRFYLQASIRVAAQGQQGHVHSARAEEGYPTTYFPGVTEAAQATATLVSPGAEIAGLDFHLHKTRVYHIRGTATNALNRQPLTSLVSVENCGLSAPVGVGTPITASVASDGTYDVSGIAPGTYCVTLEQTQRAETLSAREDVTVTNRDVEGVALAATVLPDVSGVVTVDGTPSNRQVSLRLEPLERNGRTLSALPRLGGNFEFANPSPQIYLLGVSGLPAGQYVSAIRMGDREIPDGRIDVRRGVGGITVEISSHPARISGSVQAADGTAAAGAVVSLAPDDRYADRADLMVVVKTTNVGSFQMQRVAPGTYKVYAWETTDPRVMFAADLRKALEAKGTAVTVRADGAETVQLKLITAEEIEAARSKLP